MKLFTRFLLLVAICSPSLLFAQNGTDSYKPIIGPEATARPVIGGVVNINLTTFSPLANITDANTDNFANNSTLLDALAADGISVLSTNTFAAGWRAGFVVEIIGGLLSADVLGAITLQTLNNGVVVDTENEASGLNITLLGASSSGKQYLNFVSSGAFDEVRIYFSNVASLGLLANSVRIYHAMAFDPDAGVDEDNGICEDQIAGYGTNVNFSAGLLGVLSTLTNPNNLIDGNKNTFATLLLPAGTTLLSEPHPYVGVTDLVNVFPSGNKAGFVIRAGSSLLSADVLNNIRIQTYLFGEFVGEGGYANGSGLLSLSALSTSITDKKRIEFVSPGKFNEVRIVFGSGIDVSVATTDIFYAYESGPGCTDCAVGLYDNSASPYTGSIVDAETGLFAGGLGACLLATLSDEDAVVTPSQADFALIGALVGVNCSGRITVSTAGTFPLGTFAGFEIAQGAGLLGLLSLSALNAITVEAFDGVTSRGSATGAALLGAGVLAGTGGKTVVGFKPNGPFNKLRITIDMGLVSVATSYRIYRAFVIEDTDADGIPDCQEYCGGTAADPLDDNIDTDGDGIPDACDFEISGTIFDDANGTTNGLIDGLPTNAFGQLYVSLVGTGQSILGTAKVKEDGTYELNCSQPGIYTLVLHTNPAGSAVSSLPPNWVNTSEGSVDPGDAPIDGTTEVTFTGADLGGVKFGINQLPDTDPITENLADVTAGEKMLLANFPLSGSDPEDGALGAGQDFVITSLPANAELYYDDVLITAADVASGTGTALITNYDPTKLTIAFTGNPQVGHFATFGYATVDAAGFPDETPATYTVNIISVLPAEGFVLSGKREGNQVNLTWTTLSEQNTSHFILERSVDGRTYTKIGQTLKAAGNSNSPVKYQFTDRDAQSPTLLYRAALIDFDGKTKHSNVVIIRSAQPNVSLQVFPNPARNFFYVTIANSGKYRIQLIEASGRVVRSETTQVAGPESTFRIHRGSLAPGQYLVKVTDAAGHSKTIQIMLAQ